MDKPISSATEPARPAKQRKLTEKEKMRELAAMSAAMVEEEGFLNHSQAALILDISPARVTELVNLGTFKRFDYLGRTYVSVREVRERRKSDIKAGRPPRGFLGRLSIGLKMARKEDPLLKFQKSPEGPYEQIKRAAKRVR